MAQPLMTVVFLLYNAEKTVPELVQAVSRQNHPGFANQADWLEVLFMDDHSRDGTLKTVEKALAQLGNPANYRIIHNETNLGLSKTLNKAFEMVRSPFVLTCHCDCFFISDRYVSSMLGLLEKNPKVAAITGQPVIPIGPLVQPGEPALPLVEKINLIVNLQDIFPSTETDALAPVGFAEGRCDGFRISALREVGFYETRLKFAGEDQILAARLREKGYEVCMAPQMKFRLSLSDEQNSFRKLVRHERLYGRAHPFIVLKNRGTQSGVMGEKAGKNRTMRTLLRASQLLSALSYLSLFLLLFIGMPWSVSGATIFAWVGLLLLMKWAIFKDHILALKLEPKEILILCALQPFLDISYTWGLLQGLWLIRTESASIS